MEAVGAAPANGDDMNKNSVALHPQFYTTPPQQHRPSSPSSFLLSPYVLNHKGRRSSLPTQNPCDGVDGMPSIDQVQGFEENSRQKLPKGNGKLDSNEDVDGRSRNAFQTGEEFYDAPEGLPEGDESDLKGRAAQLIKAGLSLSYPEEVARRIKAEESLTALQQRWTEMVRRCWSLGQETEISDKEDLEKEKNILPNEDDTKKQGNFDPLQVLLQRLEAARLVASSVARAAACAEKDEELENMMENKNKEISRLCDKLQYYELVNQQMFQRNQEIIEASQRQKRRRQKRQKMILGCLSAAFGVGTAGLIFYKLLPWEQHIKREASNSDGV